MSECNCITQKIYVSRYKKVLNWKDKFPFFGMGGYEGISHFTIHANTITELDSKKAEIKAEYEKKYPDQVIYVRATY